MTAGGSRFELCVARRRARTLTGVIYRTSGHGCFASDVGADGTRLYGGPRRAAPEQRERLGKEA
jgi:hypothetical protein